MQSLPLGECVIEVDLRAAAHLVDHATRQAVLIWEKVMPTPVGFSTFAALPEEQISEKISRNRDSPSVALRQPQCILRLHAGSRRG
jgi:hypothetical protein